MQELTGGPRSGLSESTVQEVLDMEHGAKTRWGVDVYESENGSKIEPVLRTDTDDLERRHAHQRHR